MQKFRTQTPVQIATIVAIGIVALSLIISFVMKIVPSRILSMKQRNGVLASACTPSAKSDKLYFVSCGGTF